MSENYTSCESCKYGHVYEEAHEWLACNCNIKGKGDMFDHHCKEYINRNEMRGGEDETN